LHFAELFIRKHASVKQLYPHSKMLVVRLKIWPYKFYLKLHFVQLIADNRKSFEWYMYTNRLTVLAASQSGDGRKQLSVGT